jgi:hypothetical protein
MRPVRRKLKNQTPVRGTERIAVAAATASTSDGWSTPEIVATIIGGAGLLLALVSLALQARSILVERTRRRDRAALAAKLEEGQTLFGAVMTGEPDRDFSDDEKRIIAWRDETIARIREIAPEQVPIFQSDAGMRFSMSQYAERDRLRNYLQGRLKRLGEIIGGR